MSETIILRNEVQKCINMYNCEIARTKNRIVQTEREFQALTSGKSRRSSPSATATALGTLTARLAEVTAEVQRKEEEISELKHRVKFTRVIEAQAEARAAQTEVTRLREMLENPGLIADEVLAFRRETDRVREEITTLRRQLNKLDAEYLELEVRNDRRLQVENFNNQAG